MNWKLVAIFAVLAGMLLIGARFGASWAGGPGFEANAPANIYAEFYEGTVSIDHAGTIRPAGAVEPIARGEIVRTGDDGYAIIQVGVDNGIALDHRTDIRIDDLRPSSLKITLIQGRIALDTSRWPDENGNVSRGNKPFENPLVIASTLGTEATVAYGRASFVNYNFKNVFAIYPLDVPTAVVLPNGNGTITKTGIEISELEPVSVTDVNFDPSTSAALDFYRWAGLIQ